MLKKPGKRHSRLKLREIWLLLGVVMLVLWGMFIGISTLMLRSMERQTEKTLQGAMESGANRVDNQLKQMEQFIKVLLISDDNFSALRSTTLERASNLRKVSLKMEEYSLYFPEFTGMFFYEKSSEFLVMRLWSDTVSYSYNDPPRRIKMRELMEELSTESGTNGKWILENVNEMWTAFYVYHYEGQYLGVYISLDGILDRIVDVEDVSGLENTVLVSEEGVSLTGDDNESFSIDESFYRKDGKNYKLMTESFQELPIVMVSLVPRQYTLNSWIGWLIGLIFLAFISGVILVYLLIHLQRSLFGPLAGLNQQMKLFSEGNLETRIENPTGCQEVRQLADTFNEMTGQIHNMKIENYERKLEMQETVLKYLQIQKNPHFFLNVLNGIYSLAASGNMMQVRTVTLELIKHVRYVLSVKETRVPLSEELEFTQNYVKIQRIRFPYEIRLETQGITEEVSELKIPPLMLQTFIENAIKYALSAENILEMRIEAEKTDTHLRLRICDSGPGYAETILQELNSAGTVSADERGEHIGIHNVLSRIRLLYQSNYEYHFSNLPSGGACVEFLLPEEV